MALPVLCFDLGSLGVRKQGGNLATPMRRYSTDGISVTEAADPINQTVDPCALAALLAHGDHFHRNAGELAACLYP